MSKPVLGYWNLRGICQPIRFIAAYLDLDIEEKRYPIDESGLGEWSKDKPNLGLDFPNLPYWKEDGFSLTESRAIIKYLAREKGNKDLMPTKSEDIAQAEAIENISYDVWQALIWRCIFDSQQMIDRLQNQIPAKFERLDKFLGSNNFFIGNKISYVDITLFEILIHFLKFDSAYLQPYPNLARFKKNFEAIPAIAKYIASPSYIESPCYHPIYVKHKID